MKTVLTGGCLFISEGRKGISTYLLKLSRLFNIIQGVKSVKGGSVKLEITVRDREGFLCIG